MKSRKQKQRIIPPILHITGSQNPPTQEQLEKFRKQWVAACEAGGKLPLFFNTPKDVTVRLIKPISPKRNRFLNYCKS